MQIAQLWLLLLHLPLDRDVLQPVGVPRYPDDVAMAADPVGDGAGRHLASEHLGPAADAHVGGDHRGSPLVAGAHQLEQQVGAALVYVEVPQLVDDQQLRAGVVLEPLLQYSPGLRVSVNLFFTIFAKQARRSRKGGFTGCANAFSPVPVTA